MMKAVKHNNIYLMKKGFSQKAHALPSQEPLSKSQQNLTMRFATILQATLDSNELIQIFAHELATLMKPDSIHYQHSNHGIDILIGKPAKHTCTYSLDFKRTYLGEISFTRKTSFSDDEITTIEDALCHLFYPLRNTLLYHQAIIASTKDPLTGAFNRANMDRNLEKEIEVSKRNGTPLSLLVLDIDNFKAINDSYGHSVGDQVLQSVVRAVADTIRKADMLYRYGGEEFTILMNNTNKDGSLHLAARIRQSINNTTVLYNNEEINVTVSQGITSLISDDDGHSLFNRADRALYQAKSNGKDRYIFEATGT